MKFLEKNQTITNNHSKKILFAVFFFASLSYGQQALITAGGNATSSLGNVSYSLGQVAYTTNGNGNYSVSEGVQQPFEISTLTVEESISTNIKLTVYPNPALDYLTLDIDTLETEGLLYTLFDINGKLLRQETISNLLTIINFTSLPSSAYFIKVVANGKNIKTFKIIKN